MNKIGVIAALPAEARCLAPGKPPVSENITLTDHILLRIGGVGRDNALAAASELINDNVDLLISWGVAAALSRNLKAGDLILADRIVSSSGNIIVVRPPIFQMLERFSEQSGLPVQRGSIIESSAILNTTEAKIRLHDESGAIAADMESAAIAEAAGRASIAFLPIRVVSDDVDTQIPSSVTRNMDDYGQVKLPGLLGSLCLNPGDGLTLLRLARGFNQARRTLEQCAGHLKSREIPA